MESLSLAMAKEGENLWDIVAVFEQKKAEFLAQKAQVEKEIEAANEHLKELRAKISLLNDEKMTLENLNSKNSKKHSVAMNDLELENARLKERVSALELENASLRIELRDSEMDFALARDSMASATLKTAGSKSAVKAPKK